MENKKLKKSKNGVGRPKYVADVEQLRQLFKQVSEKAITNEEGWALAHCHKTKWYQLKKELEENI